MSGVVRRDAPAAVGGPVTANPSLMTKDSDILNRVGAAADKCLRALLIAAVMCLIGINFRSGIERGDANRFFNSDFGMILNAVCATLSNEKYDAGRYVCAKSAEQQMHGAGLWYTDDALARAGKTLSQWEADGKSLNEALAKVFTAPPLGFDGGIYAYGWGGDSGYMDFVQSAFWLFGTRLQALYYGFFLLLSISTVLFCTQFWRNHFALFAILAFQFSFLPYSDFLADSDLGSLSNPRALSVVAIVPMLHALFLMVYRVRFGLWMALLFGPQAVLAAAIGDFRALSYAAFIALASCCIALSAMDWNRLTLRQAFWRCWPAYALLICLMAGAGMQAATADPRIAEVGGMRYHTLWEPLFWDFSSDPVDWRGKYRAEFKGATGDAIAQVAVQSYRERHNLLHVKSDFVHGDESQGITQVAYEKYIRAAYIEFARNNPEFIARLKYYNALTVITWSKPKFAREWSALDWRLLALSGLVGFALVMEVRRKTETLRRLSICAGLVALSGFVIILPVWATAIEASIMTDLLLLNVTASFMLALLALVCAGVLTAPSLQHCGNAIANRLAKRQYRKLKAP